MPLRLVSLASALLLTACQPEDPATAPGAEVPAVAAVDATPVATPGQAEVSCLQEVGTAAADRLVERCVAVSPATRPPCNVANPCALITEEIERGCGLFPEGEKPAACAG